MHHRVECDGSGIGTVVLYGFCDAGKGGRVATGVLEHLGGRNGAHIRIVTCEEDVA